MFFLLSKIFWALFSPLTLIGLLFVAGTALLTLKKEKWGRRLLSAGATLFILAGFLPIGPNLVVFLETRYPVPAPLPDQVDGVIVLGGAVNSERSQILNQVSIGEYGERLTEMIKLSRTYPQARILYSGGEGRLIPGSASETAAVQKLLQDLKIPRDHFIFESQSRNTYENMKYSFDLVHPQAGEKWLLLTSAFHLPRSTAIFEKAGWHVIPYPAGYLEDNRYFFFRDLDVLGNFFKLQVAMKEIVGIIAYSLTGKL
jgi:uncharacterized SAM-binding protein YcdF (DUF218 family)